MNKLLHTPEGVRDLMGERLKNKREATKKMMSLIKSHKYEHVEMPAFEFFDMFSEKIGTIPSGQLYKFFDTQGNTLALRPDFTPSIARISTKYFADKKEAIRLCYEGSVFINHKSYQGRLKERTQLGAEYIGQAGIEADLEIIDISISCLLEAGLKEFNITVGHADILDGIIELGSFEKSEAKQIREYIYEKNYYGLEDYLSSINTSEKIKGIIQSLLECDGTGLDKLIVDVNDSKLLTNALNHLIDLQKYIEKSGKSEYISFDLGLLSNYEYYTGIIFSGFAYGSGAPLLTGGRYDKLLSEFGKDAPAIGMAVLIDNVLLALDAQDSSDRYDDYITVALGKGRLAKNAMKLFEKIGIPCEEINDKDTRKLIFVNEEKKMRFFLAKSPDVPTYVEHGAADIGIVGKDTILEESREIYEVLDLGFGACRMCVCGPQSAKAKLDSFDIIHVSTKYPQIAKDYFYNQKNRTVEIIKLNGSIELAPLLEVSDVIVDIVETGSTLRENGLDILETICDLSARVVANPVSMRMKRKRIDEIIKSLKEAK